jgi:hypothetical protein
MCITTIIIFVVITLVVIGLCVVVSACLMIRFERMSCVILIPTKILHGIWLGVRYNYAKGALSYSAHCQLVDKKLLLIR